MKSKIKAACGGMLLVAVAGPAARGQVSPPEIQQLDQAIGERVEATAVLGTQSIASRSGLGWTLNDASGNIYKIPWKFELQDAQALGATGLTWAPVFEGGAGFAQFANNFNNNALAGNESDFTTLALSIGVGPRLYFGSSGFSVLPAFDFLFAYTENNFTARTPAGQAVVDDGRFVNWEVYTVSFVPSFELRYQAMGALVAHLHFLLCLFQHPPAQPFDGLPELSQRFNGVGQQNGSRLRDALVPARLPHAFRGRYQPHRSVRRAQGGVGHRPLLPDRRSHHF